MGGWRAETEMVVYDAYANKTRWNTYMPADRDTTTFDYGVAAELFMARRKGGARQPLSYRRFATAVLSENLIRPGFASFGRISA
jgi:hypothetical protein